MKAKLRMQKCMDLGNCIQKIISIKVNTLNKVNLLMAKKKVKELCYFHMDKRFRGNFKMI
jgi:hypothetical protein